MKAPKDNVLPFAPPLPKGRSLNSDHRDHLRKSGLTDLTIASAELYSETSATKLAEMVHWSKWSQGTGLVIPFFLPGQAEPVMYRVRPDRPRQQKREGKTSVVKYEQPKGAPVVPFFPPTTRRGGGLTDIAQPMLWTEGEKKALLLDQLGYPAIGGTGVYCFHDVAKRDAEGMWVLHAALREHATLAGREHRIVFDSDSADNDQVMMAARRLAGMLEAAGAARVLFVRIPAEGDAKLGIDDFHEAHGEAATRALLDSGTPIAGLPPEEIYTPLSSVRAFAKAPIEAPLRIPQGYTVDRQGAIWKQSDKPEGEDRLVAKAAILIRRIVLDLYTGEERVELVFKRKGTWRTLLVDRRAMCEARALISAAAAYGAPVEGSTAAGIVTWLSDLEHVNERRIPRTTCVSRCGWHKVDDERVFVAPGVAAAREDLVFDDRAGKATVAGLGVRGDADLHLGALRDIVGQSTAAAVAVFGSLAAPLLERLDAPNFAIHLHGDSSRGKSTMLRAGASVFGDPHDHAWVASWNSTAVGLEVRAHILSDLPFCVDEAGVAEDRARTAAVYMLVNGVGRARGQKDGGLRSMLGWRTTVLSTGERELVPDDANTGAQIRVLQCPVDGIGSWGAPQVEAFNALVRDHHGHVGALWLAKLAEMADDEWEALRVSSRRLASAISEQSGGQGIRARQAAYIATLMVTERLAHRLLGLGCELGDLTCALADSEAQDTPEVESAAERALGEVSGWLSANLRTAFAKMSGSGAGAEIHDSHVRGELAGYYRDEGRPDRPRQLWVLPRALKKVLKEHGHDYSVMREWRQRGWIDAETKRYDRNQRAAGRVVRVVCLDPETFWGAVVPTESGYNDD